MTINTASKTLIPFVFLLLTLTAASTSASSASFDCHKAKGQVEKAICSDPELSKLDEEMATEFDVARSTSDREGLAVLKDSQKRWLTDRDKLCETRIICLRDLYKAQMATLRNWKKCAGLSHVLDKPQTMRPRTLTRLKSSSREGGDIEYLGLDVDADGDADEVIQSCGSQGMPCNLFVSMTGGGNLELEEERFYLARFRSDLLVIVGDSAFEGRKPGAVLNRSIYQVKKTGIDLICRRI